MGSPSWQKQHKVPPLTVISQPSFPSLCPPMTERRNAPASTVSSGHNTERNAKEPLLFLDVNLRNGIRRVNVYPGDCPQSLAESLIGNSNATNELACLIEIEINKYCCEIRSIQRSKKNKALYKIKVRLSNKNLEIIVKDGDKVEDLAKEFAETHRLSQKIEANVLKLLIEAESRQKNALNM